MYRPAESPTVIATDDSAVLFTKAFLIGFRITNPESQNTGIETTQPISSTASTGLFLPTSLITISASLKAAPVFSSMVPINAPSMITIPILENVPANPAPITLARPCIFVPSSKVLSTKGIPATSPKISDIHIIDINGCTPNFEMATIITITAKINTNISGKPVITLPPSSDIQA